MSGSRTGLPELSGHYPRNFAIDLQVASCEPRSTRDRSINEVIDRMVDAGLCAPRAPRSAFDVKQRDRAGPAG